MNRLLLFSALLISTQMWAQNAQKSFFGRNLIENSGAEAALKGNAIPSWTPEKPMADNVYLRDTFGRVGEWAAGCDQKCGLPPRAGKSYFRLPVTAAEPYQALSQKISLAGLPDTSRNLLSLQAYVSGMICEKSGCAAASLGIVFHDKAGKELGNLESKRDNAEFKLAAADDARMMKFELLSVQGEVPAGAVDAVVTISARTAACCPKASVFFDNVRLHLMQVKRTAAVKE